jgi:hypothetical protein
MAVTTTPSKKTAARRVADTSDVPDEAPDAEVSDAVQHELDTFDPPPETLTLSDDTEIRLLDLKTRQFFRLMRILTRGAGSFLMQSRLSLNDDVETFITKILGVLIVAVPEAEDETIDFVTSMIEPVGLVKERSLGRNRDVADANQAMWDSLSSLMENPELEDLLDILEAVLQREAKDILRLGKRLQRMFEVMQRSGQLKALQTDASSESAETSTASTPTSE